MTIDEAIKERHSVRKYTDRAISQDDIKLMQARIDENNSKYNLSMRLITDNEKIIRGLSNLTFVKGAKTYLALCGRDGDDLDVKLGYCGCDVMLYVQTLGLNTLWVGGTYNKKAAEKAAELPNGERMTGVIVIGYGETQGVPHKSKSASAISSYEGEAPEWFRRGVEYALLAPTAINKQGFFIKGSGNTVEMTCKNGAFSDTDLGIGKYHFEVGAGTQNFKWK